MTRNVRYGLALFAFSLLLREPLSGSAPPEALVICRVRLLTMTAERVVEDAWVAAVDGRISAVGTGSEAAEAVAQRLGARLVDGGGGYLLPGLIEPHLHLRNRMSLDLLVGHGVTTARNMDGTPQVLEWREAIARGQLVGPTLISGSPFLHRYAEDSPERYAGSVADAVRLAREYAAAGYDAIKIAELDDEPFFALIEEARALGVPVVGHIPNYDIELETVLAAGMQSIEHLEELFRVYFDYEPDASRIEPFVELVRRSGVPISTLLYSEEVKNGLFAELEGYLTPERLALVERYNGPAGVERIRRTVESIERGDWERHPVDMAFVLRLVEALHEAGVVLVPGTDSGGSFVIAGIGLHEELALFRRAGLSPYEALLSATVHSAQVLGLAARKGTIEIGKDADLVLVRADPLEDLGTLREPVGVALRGAWLEGEELERLRQRTFDSDGT